MARPLRLEFPRALYHVTARGNDRGDAWRDMRAGSSRVYRSRRWLEAPDERSPISSRAFRPSSEPSNGASVPPTSRSSCRHSARRNQDFGSDPVHPQLALILQALRPRRKRRATECQASSSACASQSLIQNMKYEALFCQRLYQCSFRGWHCSLPYASPPSSPGSSRHECQASSSACASQNHFLQVGQCTVAG